MALNPLQIIIINTLCIYKLKSHVNCYYKLLKGEFCQKTTSSQPVIHVCQRNLWLFWKIKLDCFFVGFKISCFYLTNVLGSIIYFIVTRKKCSIFIPSRPHLGKYAEMGSCENAPPPRVHFKSHSLLNISHTKSTWCTWHISAKKVSKVDKI